MPFLTHNHPEPEERERLPFRPIEDVVEAICVALLDKHHVDPDYTEALRNTLDFIRYKREGLT